MVMNPNIRIVLVETSHPGNIGAAARAMKNMGLGSLTLVSPHAYPNAEATARASGADDVLANASVVRTLPEALNDCRLVIGASARLRSLSWPVIEPREAASKVIETAKQVPVAIVFGREKNGLSNSELEQCHYLMHIPSNSDYSSLNLAAAVQVMSYEILLAGRVVTDQESSIELAASSENMNRFYDHLENTLVKIEFLDPKNPGQLIRRMKRLYNRAQPDETEINILRGILTAIDKITK